MSNEERVVSWGRVSLGGVLEQAGDILSARGERTLSLMLAELQCDLEAVRRAAAAGRVHVARDFFQKWSE